MTIIPKLIQGAEPQFYQGNKIGCLVTHGFMASPAEVAWMGQYLAKAGHTVYVPRLTGHGIDPKHMKRMRWEDWYGQVLDGYHILRQTSEKIILIGHSMGGLLSILLATSEKIDALVLAATPLSQNKTIALRASRWIYPFLPFTQHPSEKELNTIIEAEQSQRGEEILSRVHYPKWATRAVREFGLLENIAQSELRNVNIPLLLLYAEKDKTATIQDAETIAAAVSSTIIEKHFLKDGAHIIFQDTGREEAFRVVADFVNRMSS